MYNLDGMQSIQALKWKLGSDIEMVQIEESRMNQIGHDLDNHHTHLCRLETTKGLHSKKAHVFMFRRWLNSSTYSPSIMYSACLDMELQSAIPDLPRYIHSTNKIKS